MSRLLFTMLAVVGSILCLCAADTPQKPAVALKGFDPVELTRGKETKGDSTRFVEKGLYRYVFATDANRKIFQNDPERFGIQFGGACMRMGPLSGRGHPDRYFVFDERIYLFASESCRNSFKANPSRFIDVADEEPTGSKAQSKQAEKLLRKALDGFGGEKVVKNLSTIQTRYQFTYKVKEKEYKYSRLVATSFPATHVQIDDYGTSKGGWLLRPDNGYLTWDKGPTVDPSVKRYMSREYYRQPIHLLRAWLDGKARAVHLGQEKIGDTKVERAAVAVAGATTILSIQPDNGRIVRVAYRGRAGGAISNIEKELSDFRKVNDLTVPFSEQMRVNGKIQDNPVIKIESIKVNAKIDQGLLQPPKK